LRVYSDQRFQAGAVLRLDILLPDLPGATYRAEVVWVDELSAGAPASLDVGLQFVQVSLEALRLLLQVVGPGSNRGSP
jgi:hypothetical protein